MPSELSDTHTDTLSLSFQNGFFSLFSSLSFNWVIRSHKNKVLFLTYVAWLIQKLWISCGSAPQILFILGARSREQTQVWNRPNSWRRGENKQADEIKYQFSELLHRAGTLWLVLTFHWSEHIRWPSLITTVRKETPPTEESASHMMGTYNLLTRKRETFLATVA